MPSINVIQPSGPKKGKDLRQKINSQIQRSQLKLQVISERNEQNRVAMKDVNRTKGANNFPNVVSPKSGTINHDMVSGAVGYPAIGGPGHQSGDKTQRAQAKGPQGIPQIRKNTQYNFNI